VGASTIHDSSGIPIGLEPLKFGLETPFINIPLFSFHHRTHWASMFSNYMSQMATIII
jgi:hypothetical protein